MTELVSALTTSTELNQTGIKHAAELLKTGQLVAFPTETVYGLGANALDSTAVQKIFDVKGRPSYNPLIVHVSSIEQAKSLVAEWPEEAQQLAEVFWPGPLTLVLKKKSVIPDVVTAGGDTVALRMPSHPVALALIEACGFPLAAPSANRSNQLSPTTAAHVMRRLEGSIPLVLDGGACKSGIESTVLNLSGPEPTVLRPGVLSPHFLSEVLGKQVIPKKADISTLASPGLLSPGLLATHYAPQTPLVLAQSSELSSAMSEARNEGKRIALMKLGVNLGEHPCKQVLQIEMPEKPEPYARDLYAVLHHLDEEHRDIIICELPPDGLEWAGVRDRLSRAGTLYSPLS